MRKFIDVTGKTEDEAISKALLQLNMDRDDVSVEILERAKSGFLGLGSCPAKVRVSYGPEEVEELPKVEAPVVEKPVEKKAEKPVTSEKKTEKKPEKKAPKKEKSAKPAAPAAEPAPVKDLGEEVNDEKAQAIRKFLAGLLEQMENQAEVKVYQPEKGRYKVLLVGEGLGALIGRRGETLDAIQQLTSYAVNRTGGRVRIQLDAAVLKGLAVSFIAQLADRVVVHAVQNDADLPVSPLGQQSHGLIGPLLVVDRDGGILVAAQGAKAVGITAADKGNIQLRDVGGGIVKAASQQNQPP